MTDDIKQNIKTELLCPDCGGRLLIMIRKADRKRFLACANYYDRQVRCKYTNNYLPQDLLMKEAAAPMLPGFGP